MADSSTVDSLLKLSRRLSSVLLHLDDSSARQLEASIFRLDRCLLDIRNTFSPSTSLLWIEDVIASLDSVLRLLSSHQNKAQQNKNSTTITSSTNDTPLTSSMSPTYFDIIKDPTSNNHPSRINHHSHRQSPRQSPAPYQHERRHTHTHTHTQNFNRPRRRSLASLFIHPPTRRTSQPTAKNAKAVNNNGNDFSRSLPSVVLNNPFSERLISSFARLVSPISTSTQSVPSSQTLTAASRTIDEWVTAVRAAKDERAYDDVDSCVSISDALPPLPQHYVPCRDSTYHAARDALLKASVRAAPSSSSSSVTAPPPSAGFQQPSSSVALYGPHGVGKTMLATELVHDDDICHNFADGVAWIQLGPDITDEELAENLIRCVDTIIAGDFRSSVRYFNSLEAIVARASRVLRHVSSLVVIDDVSGPRAQRAFDLVSSAIGPSSVILYTTPARNESFPLEDEEEEENSEVPISEHLTCVAQLSITCLDPTGQEAMSVFRNWLTKSTSDESRDGSLKHVTDQNTIISRCHGLPLALAMAGGFLSKFHNSWTALAVALSTCEHADDSIDRILRLLHTKGGTRFEQQLKAIGSLPHGMWVSLSALADLWEMDYRTIKVSARRLGRMAFGEYRLSDSSDESRVRFHWHVVRYCACMTKEDDEREANRRLLANLSRRHTDVPKMHGKIQYLPWWSGIITDKYLCRRLHWHIARGDGAHSLNELICDYQWVCKRLENDGLLGMMTEFKTAMLIEDSNERDEEFQGIARIAAAVQEAAKLRHSEVIQMNALPTFLTSILRHYESSSRCVRDFLASMYEKARRPWLKPMPEVDSSSSNSIDESTSTGSSESEMPYVSNCLASSVSGKFICGDGMGNIQVYDPATGKKVVSWTGASMGGSERYRAVGALGTVQDFVISGHYNGHLLMRSIRSGRVEILVDCEGDGERFTCIETSENGMVAVGSHKGTVFILRSVHDFGHHVKRINLEGHCDMVTALYIFPDEERIASSSCNGFAAIWKLRGNGRHERISLNGHRPDLGHKENYITTFATVGGGKRLLSACRAGVVSAWNSATGECVWTKRYGYEFSRSASLQSFGVGHFAGMMKPNGAHGLKSMSGLRVGYPYLVTRGEGPRDLVMLAAGERREVVATVDTENIISSWLEMWHPDSRRIFVAVSFANGRLSCYELVTSLR